MRMKIEEKIALVEDCRASGMTAKSWCEAKGIHYQKYLNWARTVIQKKEQQGLQWADVTITKEEQSTSEIRLICGKWTICVGSGFCPSLLTQVLKVVDTVC